MKNSRFRHIFNHFGVAVVTAVMFGGIGTYFLRASFAASYSSNPTAYADYCALENDHTVLYGWAYDPESNAGDQPYVTVKVGSGSWTLASNISTYRVAQVNSWIDTYYAGAPKMGTYGWRLEISGLYKGTSQPVSGTVTNVGAGANTTLQVNDNFTFPGEGAAKTIFTTAKKVPDACLATAPAPTPTPTPTPAPTTTTPKTTTPKTTTPKTSTPKTTTPAAPTLSGEADATVTPGTTVATLSIPAGNATSLYVRYGTDADSLDRSSEVQKISGATATVQLENLTGKTTYTYQIVRTLDKQTTTSVNATFTTKSYTVTLLFTDGSGKPVSGVKVQLGKNKAVTSGKDGKVTFTDMGNGSYSAVFTYAGMNYSEDFTTSSAKENSATGNAVLTDTIDLSKLQKTAQTASKKGQSGTKSSAALPVLLCILLLLAGGIVWWVIWRKRRREKEAEAYLADYATPMPSPYVSQPTPAVSPEPQAVVTAVAHHKGHRKAHEPAPAPSHMGESLRDMVLQSMAEESAKHPENHNKKPPIVPGG